MSIENVNFELETSDVGLGIRKISQKIVYSDLTDTSLTGTLTMTDDLPEGAFVIGTKVTVITAFAGGSNTTATLMAGKTDGEDEFTDGGTVDVISVDVVGKVAEDPLEYLAADTDVYLVVTVDSDFTTISAGEVKVELFYFSTVLELP